MPQRMTAKINTKRLKEHELLKLSSEPAVEPAWELTRPWRIALNISKFKVQLVFDIFGEITIGREPDGSALPFISLHPFVVDDDGVSRKHASFSLRGNRVYVTDLKSLNQTYLNGRALRPFEANLIQHGDKLVLGGFPLEIEFVNKPF